MRSLGNEINSSGLKRILIAEDSGPSRLALCRTLEKWDYEVVACRDGESAWEELQKPGAPQLAILDWMMPGYNGVDICRMIRDRVQETYTYLLLLTSKSLRDDLIEGLEAGADDYVTKPFDEQELQVRLRAGLRILKLQNELVAAKEALREQATRDSLTGLWNRRSILEILERELKRSQREQSSVGLMVLDLDRFKLVNDVYGHLAGDDVLRETASRLVSSVRPYDGVGRYGGEEFLIVLPGCDDVSVRSRGEAIRRAIGSLPMIASGVPVDVTASLGATVYSGPNDPDAKELVRAADEALYDAKRSGRNRVLFRSTELVARR
ncbi:MAG: diguanylate cyclase [Acidobacteria bacterium]|nr:diguanylate cyclase [Acidobacteriota bacterium]